MMMMPKKKKEKKRKTRQQQRPTLVLTRKGTKRRIPPQGVAQSTLVSQDLPEKPVLVPVLLPEPVRVQLRRQERV